MSEEKQIEEMAKDIHKADIAFLAKCIEDVENALNEDFVDKIITRQEFIAKYLYNAGYLKQSVSFWGVAKVYNEYLMCHQPRTVCGLCGYELGYEGCCVKPNFCPNCGAKMKGGE